MSHPITILCPMLCALLLAAGCRTPNGVLFFEGAKFALDATASASDQSQPLTFSVGYKRDIGSIVPKKCVPDCKTADPGATGSQPDEDALSMISGFSVRVEQDTWGWPNDLVIRNNFASGRAARALADPPTTPAPGAAAPGGGAPTAAEAGDERIRHLLRGVR